MKKVRPDLGNEDLEQRAALIIAMLEGMMLLIGGKKSTLSPFNTIKEKTEHAVLQILKE